MHPPGKAKVWKKRPTMKQIKTLFPPEWDVKLYRITRHTVIDGYACCALKDDYKSIWCEY
jgi:hypothetical protein